LERTLHGDGRRAVTLCHMEAHGNTLRQFLHVRDDPDHPAIPSERFDRVGDHVKRGWIKRAKPFVEKDRVKASTGLCA
jgi:hypothetical protein